MLHLFFVLMLALLANGGHFIGHVTHATAVNSSVDKGSNMDPDG